MFIKNDACDWKKQPIEDHDHGRKKSWNWIVWMNKLTVTHEFRRGQNPKMVYTRIRLKCS